MHMLIGLTFIKISLMNQITLNRTGKSITKIRRSTMYRKISF